METATAYLSSRIPGDRRAANHSALIAIHINHVSKGFIAVTDTSPSEATAGTPEAPSAQTTHSAQSDQSTQDAPPPPSAPDPHPLDPVIASVRAAVAPGASTEARAIGANACRAILMALETQPGQPLTTAATLPASPLAAALNQLAALPREQIIEFLQKLAASAAARPTAGPRFHLIEIPQRLRRPGGGP
jgi:hypothetical protein